MTEEEYDVSDLSEEEAEEIDGFACEVYDPFTLSADWVEPNYLA